MELSKVVKFFGLSDTSELNENFIYETFAKYDNGFVPTESENADYIKIIEESGATKYLNRDGKRLVEALVAKDTYEPIPLLEAEGVVIMHDMYKYNHDFASKEYFDTLHKIIWFGEKMYYDDTDAVCYDCEYIPVFLEDQETDICYLSHEKHLRKNLVSLYYRDEWKSDCRFFSDFVPVFKDLVEHNPDYKEVLFGFEPDDFEERTFLPEKIFNEALNENDVIRISHNYVAKSYLTKRNDKGRFVRDFFEDKDFVDTYDEYHTIVKNHDKEIIGYTYYGQCYMIDSHANKIYYLDEDEKAYFPEVDDNEEEN